MAIEYPITIEEALIEVRDRPTIDLWPHAAILLGVNRDAIYGRATQGDRNPQVRPPQESSQREPTQAARPLLKLSAPVPNEMNVLIRTSPAFGKIAVPEELACPNCSISMLDRLVGYNCNYLPPLRQ
jgi:hypothetical protein